MSTFTAILEPHPDGTLHLPLPAELRHGKFKVVVQLESAESPRNEPKPACEPTELLVEYATYQMNSQFFVQKYQLYLPNREELRRELEFTLHLAEERAQNENE